MFEICRILGAQKKQLDCVRQIIRTKDTSDAATTTDQISAHGSTRRVHRHLRNVRKGNLSMTIAITRPVMIPEIPAYASDSDDRIALIDPDGYIVGVNNKWLALAEQAGATLDRVGIGANYLDVCRQASSSCPDAREAFSGIRSVLKGKLQSFTMDYSCELRSGLRYFRMGVTPIRCEGPRFVIAHTDITELRLSKEKSLKRLQKFARCLINAQEEERERIAREIHDDLGNRIALLSFSVRRIMNHRSRHSGPRIDALNQIIDNITDLSNALRNLSHCLHPPLLKHAGICAALKALCEEFEKTQGIQIDVVVPAELPSLPDEVGLCIFRVSQECLHNIAKHAEAPSVSVVLERTPREVRLKVSDTGRGFVPSETNPNAGLGLISMKERVLCIRGHLDIRSGPGAGTEIRVTIPLSNKKSMD
jgi:signal transduction histidine kinase